MNLPHLRLRSCLAFGLVAAFLIAACSKQGEGDRCSKQNDNNDCESGLVCTSPLDPSNELDEVSRCCPPEGSEVSDARCARLRRGSSGTGTGAAGASGDSTSSTSTSGAQTCAYTSECAEGMICGPSGTCQDECLEDRDCAGMLVCVAGRCVISGAAGGS